METTNLFDQAYIMTLSYLGRFGIFLGRLIWGPILGWVEDEEEERMENDKTVRS